jgi:hypothetical protein
MAVYAALSTADIVSIALAGAAFAVSSMTLWLTVLRRPCIEIDRVELPYPWELTPGGDWVEDYYPLCAELRIVVFVANTGATGTVVESIKATGHHEDGAGELVWANVSPLPVIEEFKLPLAVDRGDTHVGVLVCKLAFNNMPPIRESEGASQEREARERAAVALTPEEEDAARQREAQELVRKHAERFAERLHALRSLSVTFKWTYRRPRLPWQRREASAKGKGCEVIEFGPEVVEHFRDTCCTSWEQSGEPNRLAEIARGERAG